MAATSGDSGKFTYDFGIAIAQSTLTKLSKLTGVSLTLAGAFYALRGASEKYVDTLRKNTLFSGAALETMQAMERAQNRLVKGISYFSVDDQLAGMRKLQSVGINVGKNLEWINKAAHATGRSFADFSGAISSAIQGNMGGLVDMGLITQRATRIFEKYGANTIMRQQAIMNFLKANKGLQSTIMSDFGTIQDQIRRIKEVWQGFLQSVIGKPNDPSSFYGQITQSLKLIADALANNFDNVKKIGSGVGMVLAWFAKQAGKFVVWVGGLAKKMISHLWSSSDSFVEWCRSLVVWLEFWKVKIIDFFKEYKTQIKWAAVSILSFMALKKAFVIGGDAILSVVRYRNQMVRLSNFLKYSLFGKLTKGEGIGKLLALKVLKKSRNREILRALGFDPGVVSGLFMRLGKNAGAALSTGFRVAIDGVKLLGNMILNLPRLIKPALTALRGMLTSLSATNPVGWVILAVTFIVILYKKCEGFRKLVNGMFQGYINYLKLLWNTVMTVYAAIRLGAQKLWEGIKWCFGKIGEFIKWAWSKVTDFFGWLGSKLGGFWGYAVGFFKWIGDSVKNLWSRIMDSRFSKWIQTVIVEPLKGVFEWVADLWDNLWQHLFNGVKWVCEKLGIATDWMANAAQTMAQKGGFQVKTFDATQFTEDGTDYLDPSHYGFGSAPKAIATNPLQAGAPAVAPAGASAPTNNTNMNFSNGAIQIIVQKGENIDEVKLARKVREVISDTNREHQIRGGY